MLWARSLPRFWASGEGHSLRGAWLPAPRSWAGAGRPSCGCREAGPAWTRPERRGCRVLGRGSPARCPCSSGLPDQRPSPGLRPGPRLMFVLHPPPHTAMHSGFPCLAWEAFSRGAPSASVWGLVFRSGHGMLRPPRPRAPAHWPWSPLEVLWAGALPGPRSRPAPAATGADHRPRLPG